ncbi:MAG: SRPBCC family protein, partial [Actinomycetota bacterium]
IVSSSHATSDAVEGVGATRHCDLTNGATLEETIREWVPEESVTISIDEATKVPIAHAVSTFSITETENGRQITMTTDFTPKGGPLGRLLGPVMKPVFRKGNRGLLAEWDAAAGTITAPAAGSAR